MKDEEKIYDPQKEGENQEKPDAALDLYTYIVNGKRIAPAFTMDTSKHNKGILTPVNSNRDLEYKVDDLIITIANFYVKEPTHFSTAAAMVLKYLLVKWQINKKIDILIDIHEYMLLRNLSSDRVAKQQLKDLLNLLYNVSIEGTDTETITDKKSGKTYSSPITKKMRIIQELNFSKRFVKVTLANTLQKELKRIDKINQVALYPLCAFKLSARDDEYAIKTLDYIVYLERIQAGQPNFHYTAVKSFLNECEFPKAEYIISKGEGRHLPERLIDPFDKAMKKLIEIGFLKSYTYMESKNKPADISRALMDFDYFIGLYVKYDTTSPNNEHLVKKKSENKEKAKRIAEKAAVKAATEDLTKK